MPHLARMLFKVAVLTGLTIIVVFAAPHDFDKTMCHAFKCEVHHCSESADAPSRDTLKIAANQNMYDSLGNDCGDIVTIPLVNKVSGPTNESQQVFCPANQGLWMSSYIFYIFRSPDNMGAAEHVTPWNSTKFPAGTNMFKANCETDNGAVNCGRGDAGCKVNYAPRPTEPNRQR